MDTIFFAVLCLVNMFCIEWFTCCWARYCYTFRTPSSLVAFTIVSATHLLIYYTWSTLFNLYSIITQVVLFINRLGCSCQAFSNIIRCLNIVISHQKSLPSSQSLVIIFVMDHLSYQSWPRVSRLVTCDTS